MWRKGNGEEKVSRPHYRAREKVEKSSLLSENFLDHTANVSAGEASDMFKCYQEENEIIELSSHRRSRRRNELYRALFSSFSQKKCSLLKIPSSQNNVFYL